MTDTAHTGTGPTDAQRFESVPAVRESLAKVDYLADEGIAGVVYLADRLGKRVLVEGAAGGGVPRVALPPGRVGKAGPRRGACRHGQDAAGQVSGRDHRRPAHPPPV